MAAPSCSHSFIQATNTPRTTEQKGGRAVGRGRKGEGGGPSIKTFVGLSRGVARSFFRSSVRSLRRSVAASVASHRSAAEGSSKVAQRFTRKGTWLARSVVDLTAKQTQRSTRALLERTKTTRAAAVAAQTHNNNNNNNNSNNLKNDKFFLNIFFNLKFWKFQQMP